MSNTEELDRLDSAIAWLEGVALNVSDKRGPALRQVRPVYQPTRNPDEILRLMDKYISKTVRMKDGDWAAVGPSGRAVVGPTLAIAVCKAIIETR